MEAIKAYDATGNITALNNLSTISRTILATNYVKICINYKNNNYSLERHGMKWNYEPTTKGESLPISLYNKLLNSGINVYAHHDLIHKC